MDKEKVETFTTVFQVNGKTIDLAAVLPMTLDPRANHAHSRAINRDPFLRIRCGRGGGAG